MRIIKIFIFIWASVIIPVLAADVPIETLFTLATELNGEVVTVQGEVLTVLRQKEGTWINVSDGTSSIGVWADRQRELPPIQYSASYHSTGDTVRVEGIFYYNDPAHYGEAAVHARTVTVVTPGQTRIREVSEAKKRTLDLTALFMVCTWLVFAIKRMIYAARAGKNP